MKQLLQNLKTGLTSVEDVPMPTPRPGQALVRVAASLISAGTERMVVEFAEKSLLGKARSRPDLVRQVVDKMKREGVVSTVQAAFNRLDQPAALGYSSAGTITALGAGMEGFTVGQRVACAGGGYAVHAEYNLVPRLLLTPLPDEVDFESAAFTTLGAIALHGLRLAEPQLGENVAVIGMGLLGLLAGQMALAAGCRVLGIDTDPARVELAKSLGIQSSPRDGAEAVAAGFTANLGFDKILICADTSSNDPVEFAAVIARDKARIVATGAVGLTLPRKVYYEKELSFINSRSYGPGRYDPAYEENGHDYPPGFVRWTEGRNFQAVVDLLASGKLNVKPLITHRFPITEAPKAYQVITAKSPERSKGGKTNEPFLGVLLTYPQDVQETSSTKISLLPSSRSGAPDIREGGIQPPFATSQPGGLRGTSSTVHRPSSVVNLGVLGAGMFANGVLLPAIKKIPGVELVGIASAAGMHAAESGKKFGFKYAASSDDEILNDPEINTVAILTRHDTHADLVVQALQAGKHVFVEKPLAIDQQGLDEILKVLSSIVHGPSSEHPSPDTGTPATGTLLLTGFNRRFSPLAVELSHFLSDRTEPLYMHYRVNAGLIPLTHWTQDPLQGGGRIIGEGCHFIDLLTCLAGAAPLSVSAHALPDQGKYRQDNVSMTFTFPDGSVGVVDYLANGDKSFPKERLEVFCAGSIAVLDDFRTLEITRAGKRTRLKKAQDKGWHAEWVGFTDAIKAGSPPPIPYDQLIGVTKATFAAVESLRLSGQVVTIQAN